MQTGYSSQVAPELQQEYIDKYNAIMRQQIPMDHGPGSANESASAEKAQQIEALMGEYGVTRPDQYQDWAKNQFKNLYGGQIQQQIGDVDIMDYTQPVQSQAQKLQEMAEAAGTEQGRFGLLRQTFGRPGERYTTGQQRLDELFLQGTSAAGQLGQKLSGIASEVGQETSALSQDLESRKTALAEMAGITRDKAEQLLLQGENLEDYQGELYGGGLEDISAGLEERLKQVRENIPNEYTAIKDALAQNTMADINTGIYEQLQDIVGDTGRIYNLNLADYLSPQDVVEGRLAEASPEQLATMQEYQRFQNLANLLGKEGMGITENMIDTFDPYQLKSDDLRSHLDLKQEGYQQLVKEVPTKVADITNALTQNIYEAEKWASVGEGYRTGQGYKINDIRNQLNSQINTLNELTNMYNNNPTLANLKKLNDYADSVKVFAEHGTRLYAAPHLSSGLKTTYGNINQLTPERQLFLNSANMSDGENILDPSVGIF
jgi:hypothetical protein